jgi:hypothetical protein
MQRTISPSITDCRIYVRPEGNHLVGLCAELKEIVTGSTIEEIVGKVKLIAGSGIRVMIHLSGGKVMPK